MNAEFIDALEEIEKEKGYLKKIFDALESALIQATRKTLVHLKMWKLK